MPVLGSGHPQADVFLLKYAPTPSEIEEGVAFYGRSGTALMKSLKRLGIDPLAVYGTLCVKCPVADTALAAPECIARLVEEIAIVQPKIVVVMGAEALGRAQRARAPARRARSRPRPGRGPEAHAVDRRAATSPDIDEALDEEAAKRAFWTAFRGSATGTRTSRPTDVPARRAGQPRTSGRANRRRACGAHGGRQPLEPRCARTCSSEATTLAPACSTSGSDETILPSLPPLEALVGVAARRAGRSRHRDAEVAGREARQHGALDEPGGGGLVLQRAGAQRRAVDATALAHQRPRLISRLGARADADDADPPALGERLEVVGEVRGADELEDDVERARGRRSPPARSRVAPSARPPRAACSSRTVAVTRAPAIAPSWTAAMPTPPAAPWTSSRSPTPSRAWVKSASWAVVKTSGTPPAATQSRLVGHRHERRARGPRPARACPPPPDDRHDAVARLEALDAGGRARRPRRRTRAPGCPRATPGGAG